MRWKEAIVCMICGGQVAPGEGYHSDGGRWCRACAGPVTDEPPKSLPDIDGKPTRAGDIVRLAEHRVEVPEGRARAQGRVVGFKQLERYKGAWCALIESTGGTAFELWLPPRAWHTRNRTDPRMRRL